MAFNPNLLTKVLTGTGGLGQQVADTILSSALPAAFLPTQLWTYQAGTDTIATVKANGYFVYFADFFGTLLYNNGNFLRIGDQIYCACEDGNIELQVTEVTPQVQTQVAPVSAGSVNSAAIQSGAVTSDEIAVGAVGSAEVSDNLIQYVESAITAAEFNGMYAAPWNLLLASAGLLYVVEEFVLAQTFGSASYAAGGAVALQYGNTVHGGGVLASATIPAASINGIGSNEQVGAIGAMGVGANSGAGLYLSNATGAFTTGDGTWHIHIWYRIIEA